MTPVQTAFNFSFPSLGLLAPRTSVHSSHMANATTRRVWECEACWVSFAAVSPSACIECGGGRLRVVVGYVAEDAAE
jgi:hypothetical protein